MNKLKLILFLVIAGVGLALWQTSTVKAVGAGDWRAGNIIDDSVFYNGNDLSAQQIQDFLNSKVPSCDTWGTKPSEHGGGTRAQYAASRGYSPPFTCLKDYTMTTPGYGADGYCGAIGGGARTAAQIIKDVSQVCGIGSKVMLVLLQKEQALVTDDWPLPNQYQKATGFACPDTAPCDAQYAGFFNQVYRAARQYKVYRANASSYRYKARQNNSILYNPNSGCGSSNVYIENDATAGLYIYTPYQPNQAALNNIYGTGDGCSAYGNRNFWRMFSDWFGSTRARAPFSWNYAGHSAYSDAGHTKQFTSGAAVAPGGRVYLRLLATNVGSETWTNSFVKLGTYRPQDHTGQMRDTSWPSSSRAAILREGSVAPGQTGSFDIVLKAPNTPGTYNEYFNVVAEGKTWLNDPGLFFTINVVEAIAPSNSSRINLPSGTNLLPGEYLLSPDRNTTLNLQQDGNLVLYANFQPIWSSETAGYKPGKLTMQSDGNLVLYDGTNKPLWNSETSGAGAYLALQTDSNLVVYNQSTHPLWASYSVHNPNNLAFVSTTLANAKLFPGQELSTANRRYKLKLQTDGNLVLYSPTRALWSAATDGKSSAYLAMQGDGNLVLYDTANRPLWNSGTARFNNARLMIQGDGNLVVYNAGGGPIWNTQTAGQQ